MACFVSAAMRRHFSCCRATCIATKPSEIWSASEEPFPLLLRSSWLDCWSRSMACFISACIRRRSSSCTAWCMTTSSSDRPSISDAMAARSDASADRPSISDAMAPSSDGKIEGRKVGRRSSPTLTKQLLFMGFEICGNSAVSKWAAPSARGRLPPAPPPACQLPVGDAAGGSRLDRLRCRGPRCRCPGKTGSCPSGGLRHALATSPARGRSAN